MCKNTQIELEKLHILKELEKLKMEIENLHFNHEFNEKKLEDEYKTTINDLTIKADDLTKVLIIPLIL